MTAQVAIKIDENNEHPRKSLVDKIKFCEGRRIDLDIVEDIFEKAGVDVAHRWGSLTSEAVRCSDAKASQIEEKISTLLENHIRYRGGSGNLNNTYK